jgi:P4 family phage/plasmid primase-like protien
MSDIPPSESEKTTLLDWALRYVKLGWPVLPLRGKIPRVPNGSKDATLNESQVRTWWTEWPDANIGVATGLRFFALDIDVKENGEESLDYLANQHGRLPDTIQQVTGTGGKHFLFALPSDFTVKNSARKIAPGIDVRGAGGYIVVAPSIHPETKARYFWDGLALIEDQKILPAPRWLLALLKSQPVPGTLPKAQSVPNQIGEGARNTTLFKIAASLRRKGFAAEEILATLRVTNSQRCTPPLPESDLKTIAESAAKYAPDAAGNLFADARKAAAEAKAPGDARDEFPLSVPDVEAAVDDLIAKNDLVGAVRLAPELAKLRPMIRAVIVAKLRMQFKRDWPAKEFERAIRDAALEAGGQQEPPDRPPAGGDGRPGGPDLLPPRHELTEAGNGQRIVELFGTDIRWCVEMKAWFVWDGKRWLRDDLNIMRQKAKQVARLLYAQAAAISDRSFAEVVEGFARKSESFAAATAALAWASSEPGIPVTAAELDQQPYLLNCPNGVVDLRTGTLLEHQREFLLTKLCPVAYDPTAECPRFLKFLHWAMGENPDADLSEHTVRLVSFLQRAFGYSLCSDISQEAFFVLFGRSGKNGKTTLLNLFRDVVGKDYGGQLLIDTVMSSKNQDATMRADLADLRGMRFVQTSEVDKEQKLDEAKIKYITSGMRTIKSCRKYENPIEFLATHKLWMDCNYRPRVRGVDEGIWRRLKCVPFEVTISEEEKDLQLPDKLRTDLAGVLAWGVRGFLAWQKDGLGDPPEVSQASLEWREHDDPIKEFLEDCCDIAEEYFCRCSDLGSAYEWWCKTNREKYPLGREAFGERVLSKGFKTSRSRRIDGKQARTWEGIQLNIETDKVIRQRGTSGAWMDPEQ